MDVHRLTSGRPRVFGAHRDVQHPIRWQDQSEVVRVVIVVEIDPAVMVDARRHRVGL